MIPLQDLQQFAVFFQEATPRKHMKEIKSIDTTVLLFTAMILLAVLLSGCIKDDTSVDSQKKRTRVVTDMSGIKVTIPETVNRVACLEVLCYEKMFLLEQTDKISIMYSTNAPWMEATNPKVRCIPKFIGDPNPEELIQRKIDIAFYRYRPEKSLARLRTLGIPGVVSQPIRPGFDTAETFQGSTKKMMHLYGEIFGGTAKRKAEEWCAYYDEKVRYITERTVKIPKRERPKTYYLRGPGALTTQGCNSNTYWYGEMAGAEMVVKNGKVDGKGPVSMEEIIRWNPEYIFVGRQYSTDLVLKDARWAGIRAVKEGKVFPLPDGVFYWDGSSEGVLLMEFMAKILHPKHFADLDLAREIKDYYRRFYGYRLTDGDADKILHGLSPDGSRNNSFNN